MARQKGASSRAASCAGATREAVLFTKVEDLLSRTRVYAVVEINAVSTKGVLWTVEIRVCVAL